MTKALKTLYASQNLYFKGGTLPWPLLLKPPQYYCNTVQELIFKGELKWPLLLKLPHVTLCKNVG